MEKQLVLPGEIGKMAPGRCLDCGKEISRGARRCRSCNQTSDDFLQKLAAAMSTPEYKRKISESIKAAYRRGAYKGFKPPYCPSPTSIELATARALDQLGIKHQPQYRPADCSYTFDEYVPPDILIEVNGDYWHSLPRSKERDPIKASWARQKHFQPISA